MDLFTRRMDVKNEDLPVEFQNIIVENSYTIIIRSNLKSMMDINNWVKEFGRKTNTNWNSRDSCPSGERFICWKKFVCHHSAFKKVSSSLNKKTQSSKNSNCPASLKIKVKVNTCSSRKNDNFLKQGLLAVITITPFHNHTINTAESLRFLPAVNCREQFLQYFDDGMGIAESAKYHKEVLQMQDNFQEVDMTNSRINPTVRTIRYWYDQWRNLHLGPRTGSDMIATETDVKNYTQYKMGFSKRLLMADGVLPSKFECQTHPRKEALNAGTSGSTFVKSGKIDLDCSRSSNDNDDTVETTAEMESRDTSFETRCSNMRDYHRKSLKHRTMKNGQSRKKIIMYKHSENLSSLNTNSESDKVQYDEPQQQTLEENDDSLHGEVPVPSDELHIKEEPCDVEDDDPLLPNVIVETELPHPKLEQCEVEIDETDLGSYVSYPNPEQFEIHPTFGPSKSRASTEPVNCPTHANKLVEYIISKNEKDTPQHPVDTFLAGIAATLKTFSPYHLHLAKAEIFNIVQKYELETIMADQHIPPNRNIMTPNSPASSSVSTQHSTNLQYHLNIDKPT